MDDVRVIEDRPHDGDVVDAPDLRALHDRNLRDLELAQKIERGADRVVVLTP